MHDLQVAVITGSHSYDVIGLERLFRGLDGIDAYIQHLNDFAASPEGVRDGYDAVVFHAMILERGGPTDALQPWYCGKPRTTLEHLGATGQGIVLLHHGLLAYPEWPVWNAIAGMDDRSFVHYHDETTRVKVVDTEHPVTAGIADWDMLDETYTMQDAGEGCRVLLRVDHPRSMRDLAWTRRYRDSRVFCYQSGHNADTWQDESFREVLRRGILWSAGRMT
ncbi:ThuA domain-containing protein [bacterium]|nr:ThuA domain-containing protein [bacterium]